MGKKNRVKQRRQKQTPNSSGNQPPAADINMSIKRDLGLRYKILRDVAVPKKIIEKAENKMSAYRRNYKQYAHATVGGKIISSLAKISDKAKSHETFEAETERRSNLENTFIPVYVWMKKVEDYFENCINIGTIQKYNQELKRDYQKLRNKGYVKQLNEINFDHFDKSEYTLNFVPDMNLKTIFEDLPDLNIPSPISEKYRIGCLQAFTNLRVVFSTYLSVINKFYTDKYKGIEYTQSGTKRLFTQCREEMDKVMPAYEHFAVNIANEMKNHSFYFKHIVDSEEVKKLNRTIDDKRYELQNLVKEAKELLLNADFINIGNKEGYRKYHELINTLKALNNDINNIATSISGGDYTAFKNTYQKALDMLQNTLPNTIKYFRTITLKDMQILDDKLQNYEKSAEQLVDAANKTITNIKRYEEDFKEQYKKAAKSFVKAFVPTAVSTSLSAASIWWNVAGPLASIFKTLSEAIAKVKTGMPNLRQ